MGQTIERRLATKAFRVELERAPTPEELKPLIARADRMLGHDRSDGFVLKRLERALDQTPEGQAVNQAHGAAKALLGAAPDPALLQQARDLAGQGKTVAEVRAALDATVMAGAPYRKLYAGETVDAAYAATLQRAPSLDERLAGVRTVSDLIDQGQMPEQISSTLSGPLAASPEARKLRSADNVNAVYAWTMGRAPSPEELAKGREIVGQLIDQGKPNEEVNAVLDYLCKLSPEWQAAHPQMNHDRDAIYLHQPTGWTCGPTSLAMAMAAAGKRAPNDDTIWELAQADKLNTIANQSTDKMPWEIADIARGMGVNAEAHVLAQPPEIREALERGHGVVVNGKLPDTSGHFIYLAGLDEQGQYIVCDPWHPEVTRWNDEQLGGFTYGRGNSVEIWP